MKIRTVVVYPNRLPQVMDLTEEDIVKILPGFPVYFEYNENTFILDAHSTEYNCHMGKNKICGPIICVNWHNGKISSLDKTMVNHYMDMDLFDGRRY